MPETIEMETVDESKTTAAGPSRDARRRKILDRGTDRLAFITGQTRAVPPPPPPPTLPSADSTPLPPRPSAPASDEQHHLQQIRERQLRESVALPDEKSMLLKPEASNEAPRRSLVRDTGVELLPRSERCAEAVAKMQKNTVSSEMLISPVTDCLSDNPVETVRRALPHIGSKIFTPSRISHCISSSENIRLLCATIIALLVVLLYHGYTLAKPVTSLVSFRPIFLVLLTDVTLVLGLLLTSQEPEKDEDVAQTSREEFDLAELLQIGLVVHSVMKAAFMDCCLCAVVMIIGIPFGAGVVA